MSAAIEPTPATPATGYFRNPWRKPRVLQGVTIGYLLWSLLPVVIAVIFSFNAGRSRISWQGFSLAVVDPGPHRLAAPRRGDARRDDADLQARDPHRSRRGAARHAVRDRHRPVARPPRPGGELHDAAVVRRTRDHPRRLPLHPVHEPAPRARAARDAGAGARSHQLPAELPGDHRAGPPAHDRPRVRGSRDGPRRHAEPGDPPDPAPADRTGDPRERRARLRRRGRRLRHGRRAVGRGRQRDARPEDLRGIALLTDARGECRRHDDADHDLARGRRRLALLPTVEPGPRGHRPTDFMQL